MVDTLVGSLYDGPHAFPNPGFGFAGRFRTGRIDRMQRPRVAGCGADRYSHTDSHSDRHPHTHGDPNS
jgi:hypothetical protein